MEKIIKPCTTTWHDISVPKLSMLNKLVRDISCWKDGWFLLSTRLNPWNFGGVGEKVGPGSEYSVHLRYHLADWPLWTLAISYDLLEVKKWIYLLESYDFRPTHTSKHFEGLGRMYIIYYNIRCNLKIFGNMLDHPLFPALFQAPFCNRFLWSWLFGKTSTRNPQNEWLSFLILGGWFFGVFFCFFKWVSFPWRIHGTRMYIFPFMKTIKKSTIHIGKYTISWSHRIHGTGR